MAVSRSSLLAIVILAIPFQRPQINHYYYSRVSVLPVVTTNHPTPFPLSIHIRHHMKISPLPNPNPGSIISFGHHPATGHTPLSRSRTPDPVSGDFSPVRRVPLSRCSTDSETESSLMETMTLRTYCECRQNH